MNPWPLVAANVAVWLWNAYVIVPRLVGVPW
jgi:hypothetical protein